MTDEIFLFHLSYRHEKAQAFILKPADYKVCDQCRSISFLRAGHCHVCGAYRFNSSRDEVITTARIISSSPFPVTAGVVPRLLIPRSSP